MTVSRDRSTRTGNVRTSRRRLVGAALAGGAALPGALARAQQGTPGARGGVVRVTVVPDAGALAFERADFGTVGVYDVDWLTTPPFSHMLDSFAASPGAFHGGRFFGSFTAGTTELYKPDDTGTVWTDPDGPIDFSRTFAALEALTARGLTPFLVLGMFPPAVSESPVQPPTDWERWRTLVRTFFERLAADPRFGTEAIATWWFEAWNEPNEGRFWEGTEEEYHALYRATSEAIADTGLPVRLGGPAIAYKPQENPDFGRPWMERFLRFIAADPALRCDFLSLHRKGTVGADPPDPRRLDEAARATADQALAVDPERFGGIPIVNNEADEKVGFEVPYAPRADHQNAAWLAAVAALHAGLNLDYREAGLRFHAAADNANLQLVEAPFDGRRSLLTLAGDSPTDLLKVPAYGFYELLRLLGDRYGDIRDGAALLYPATGLYHLATHAETHVACLLTHYPDVDVERPVAEQLDYVVEGLPWSTVNVARFQIDRTHSNAYTAAGGSAENAYPVPDPSRLPAIREAQEIALLRPIARNVSLRDGTYRERIALEPYATTLLWITPVDETPPAAPGWVTTDVRDGNVVLRWEPVGVAALYGYEVVLLEDGGPGERLSPDPLRAALWVDTAPVGERAYGVRAVSASGVKGPWTASDAVRAG